jgi:DNA polymerase
VKKYDAFLRSACADDHVKGCFQFFGGHTGRFAGRLVQLQNLKSNHLEDLDLARTVAKEGDAAGFELLWPNVSGAISELVRTVLIPEEGQRFIVADFSAIEARVSAWLAGEEWVLQSFRDGKDIYCETASQMFKVPVEKHGQNSELRAKGKIAVLACIAEDEPVLTDRGLVPIQDVRITDRVWDGEEWVAHKGVIYKGEREVITYEGLTATPDHVVFTREGGTILFGRAAACGAHLLQPGAGGKAVRARRDHLRGTPMERVVESLLRADPLCGLRTGAVDRSRQSAQREKPGLSELLRAAAKLPKMAVQARHGSKDALHQPEPPELGELRRTRDHVRLPVPGSGVRLDRGEPRPASALGAAGAGPDRQRQGLRAGEHPLGDTGAEPRQPALHPYRGVAAGGLAVRLQRGAEEAPSREDARRYPGRCAGSRRGEAKKLARHQKVVRVYDIVDAGPRHRYTVSGVLVHNCGYGGGVGALKAFGADRMGMTPEEMTETIDRWRSSNPRIVAAWKSLERAMARCIVHHATTVDKVCGIRFRWDRGIVWMRLPSGREMAYYGAAYGPSRRSGREGNALSYMGIDQTSRKWVAIETFGGRVFENLVQATARDVLREAMFSLEAKGFDIRATVHDECICTEPIGGKTVEQMCEAMCPDVPWMAGLPLKAAGYEGAYYFKD